MEKSNGSLFRKKGWEMEEYGSQRFSQLRRVAKVYCPVHGHSEVSMLSPIVCPSCEREGQYSDMLRRPTRKERRRERAEYERSLRLEADENMEGGTSRGKV